MLIARKSLNVLDVSRDPLIRFKTPLRTFIRDAPVKRLKQETWQVLCDDQARRDDRSDRSSGCAFLTIKTCQVFPFLLPLPAPWLEAHLRQQIRPIFQRGHDDAAGCVRFRPFVRFTIR